VSAATGPSARSHAVALSPPNARRPESRSGVRTYAAGPPYGGLGQRSLWPVVPVRCGTDERGSRSARDRDRTNGATPYAGLPPSSIRRNRLPPWTTRGATSRPQAPDDCPVGAPDP